MSKVDVAALLALCAALASAVGDVIRQRSAQEITDKQVGHLELFRMSLRDTPWWLGGLAAIVNYSLQAGALAWGSVVLVTALQVTALLFALPIYARLADHRVTRWEWMWAVVLAGALAVVIIVGDPASGHQRAPLQTWVIVALVMVPLLVSCVVAARIWTGSPFAAMLLAVVAGSSLALFAVLTKGVVEVAEDGLLARAAFAGVRPVDIGRLGRDDLPAVGLPRRCADRLLADDDRGEARRRRFARGYRAGRDAACPRPEGVRTGRGGGGGDRRDGRAGPR